MKLLISRNYNIFDTGKYSFSGIYKAVNSINGKIYIGSTNDGRTRIVTGHINSLNKRKHANPHLQAAWTKYGAEAFEWYLVEETTPADLLSREQYYLDTLQPYKETGTGYNIARCATASMKGRKATAATKLRSSIAHKNNKALAEHCKALGLATSKTASFISPDNKLVTFTNYSKFARDNALTLSSVCRLASQKIATHRGWKLAPSPALAALNS